MVLLMGTSCPFAVPHRERALAILRAHELAPLLVMPHEIVHEASASEHLGYVTSVWERIECGMLDGVPAHQAVMLLGLGDPVTVLRACEAFAESLPDIVEVSSYPLGKGPHAVRVRAPGHDKHTGLARVADGLGVARERVAAVGDWFNDMGMLKWAGHSFAMNGAPELVCDAAKCVLTVRAGQGGGVAEAIERWLASD